MKAQHGDREPPLDRKHSRTRQSIHRLDVIPEWAASARINVNCAASVTLA